ncbi:MAG: hypothetical protein OEO20_14370 [Gemmatimonadota bacterium]|nr:hypothetical protein [Gemmatimonadota bacterium]MDH3367999.1 hypothetical protein [Gemmatimonadota bacterium]MDH3479478.1 hypothetical protein [Gemmatimonadota bacterium]MDH3570060.1 hypothetical protein [Gemmatimonadota bacterium]MDH5550374.1 hypothetical protein [Gemmatimonadota bacterium]
MILLPAAASRNRPPSGRATARWTYVAFSADALVLIRETMRVAQ